MNDAPVDLDLDLEIPASSGWSGPVLEVRDLSVTFPSDDGPVQAVSELNFDLFDNETLGIVGESGSGKSVTSMSILGLLPASAKVTGSVKLRGRELLGLSDKSMQPVRGKSIAMVFQDALTALNPVYTVGTQIAEAIKVHDDVSDDVVRGSRARTARHGRYPEPGPARRSVPARVLRWYAAASDDRHDDRQRARSADRRRADHRARCHDPGAGARGTGTHPGPHQELDHPHHPRPRCRRRGCRPGAGHVRRTASRARDRRRPLLQPAPSRTREGCWRRCRASTADATRVSIASPDSRRRSSRYRPAARSILDATMLVCRRRARRTGPSCARSTPATSPLVTSPRICRR